jgi:hypothetical protein
MKNNHREAVRRSIGLYYKLKVLENFSTESANYTNISYLETSNEVKTFSSLVPATMFATGVFGNSFALFVLCNSPKDQRRTIFYRLVAALAFNDLQVFHFVFYC